MKDLINLVEIQVTGKMGAVQIGTLGDTPLAPEYRGWFATLDEAGVIELISELTQAYREAFLPIRMVEGSWSHTEGNEATLATSKESNG